MKSLLAVVGFVLTLAAAAPAQPIAVEVTVTGSSPVTTFHADNAHVTVVLGNVSANTLIRIYDDAANGGVPSNSVGKVVIDGSVVSGSPLIRVLVAAETTATFPSTSTATIANGIVNLGGTGTGAGIKVYNSANSSDTSLRDRTRIAVGVSGDVTGTIHVAEVFEVAQPRWTGRVYYLRLASNASGLT